MEYRCLQLQIGSLLHSIALSTPTQTTKISENEDDEIVLEKEENSNIGPILLSIFMFGISAAMVYGIYKVRISSCNIVFGYYNHTIIMLQNNRRYILPWLVIKGIESSVLTIITVVLFFLLFVSDHVGILFIVFFIIAAFAGIYFHWLKLENSRKLNVNFNLYDCWNSCMFSNIHLFVSIALFWYFFICVWSLYMDMGETMSTIVPMGQSIPMTEPNIQYEMNDPIKSPPQEMV